MRSHLKPLGSFGGVLVYATLGLIAGTSSSTATSLSFQACPQPNGPIYAFNAGSSLSISVPLQAFSPGSDTSTLILQIEQNAGTPKLRMRRISGLWQGTLTLPAFGYEKLLDIAIPGHLVNVQLEFETTASATELDSFSFTATSGHC